MAKLNNQNIKKVVFIKTLFKRYQPTLSVVEQFALLDMWITSCVDAQEFEMASALLKEKRFISSNPNIIPRRMSGDMVPFDDEKNPLFSYRDTLSPIVFKKKKQTIYSKIINKIKKFFKWRN